MTEKQTRRRGTVLERAIREAAWQELSERGWAGFTIEAVAARSGTAKSVIYRRWGNRVQLAQDILTAAIAGTEAGPSDGPLRTDLLAFLTAMTRFLSTPFGDAARGVVLEGDPLPSWFGRTAVLPEICAAVEAAVARGELAQVPPAFVMNLGPAVVMGEFLYTRTPPSSAALAELVDTAWLPALRCTS